ncbi:hypothetical protein MAR_031797 [Mya arenaria]|uniref:Uncharacterized protein n=1 Tax=Mya arenaria TaxID=6604 RepID=A0ABY7F4T9_MYAAR|nr:hypothetical protein MAR_031797 [Mya arenaria]
MEAKKRKKTKDDGQQFMTNHLVKFYTVTLVASVYKRNVIDVLKILSHLTYLVERVKTKERNAAMTKKKQRSKKSVKAIREKKKQETQSRASNTPIKPSEQAAQNKGVNKRETNCVDLTNERSSYFDSILKELRDCPSYTTLKRKCQNIDYDTYNIIPHCVTMCSSSDLEADFNAVDFMPNDI